MVDSDEERRALHDALARSAERRCDPAPRPTIHWTELPPRDGNTPFDRDCRYFRRELGRLLAEGREGEWVLIKDERIVDFFRSKAESQAEADARFPMSDHFAQQILERYPLIVLPPRYLGPCHKTPSAPIPMTDCSPPSASR